PSAPAFSPEIGGYGVTPLLAQCPLPFLQTGCHLAIETDEPLGRENPPVHAVFRHGNGPPLHRIHLLLHVVHRIVDVRDVDRAIHDIGNHATGNTTLQAIEELGAPEHANDPPPACHYHIARTTTQRERERVMRGNASHVPERVLPNAEIPHLRLDPDHPGFSPRREDNEQSEDWQEQVALPDTLQDEHDRDCNPEP